MPLGSVHSTDVGMPAAPGLSQYVCQPLSIFNSMPAVIVVPGLALSCDNSSLALVAGPAAPACPPPNVLPNWDSPNCAAAFTPSSMETKKLRTVALIAS